MLQISLFNLVFGIVLAAISIEGLDKFIQSECGNTKSCMRWSSCDFPYCDYAISWKEVNYNGTKYLQIEMVGTLVSQANGYVALGFSLENNMNHNGIVMCYLENGQMNISAGYNEKPHNQLLNDNETDPNLLVKVDGQLYGIEYISGMNILRCRFLRLMTPTKFVEKLFNLVGPTKYHLVNAKGQFTGRARYHGANKRSSPNKYNMESTAWIDYLVSSDFRLIKCHACLMIFGWVFFATNGIIMAYFYKNNWGEKKMFGGKIWFQFHQLVQSLCVICVAIGFIIIFIKVRGYSDLRDLPYTAHPAMGIVATALMIINPIMALFRCHPDNSSRWIFNAAHLVVGISAYVLAICTIVIGIQLPQAGPHLQNLRYPWILVIVFLILIILLFIYGEVQKRINFNSINVIRRSYNLSSNDQEDSVQTRKAGNEIIILSAIISLTFGIAFLSIILAN